jgi:O-glycosyl hydrolase
MRSTARSAASALTLGLALAQSSITVNVATTLQRIDGFGMSQAFGRAKEFEALGATSARQTALDYLFNTTTGAGLTIIRNCIGSTTATGNSIEPKNPGGPTATPSYVWDSDDSGQVWFSQAVSDSQKYILFYTMSKAERLSLEATTTKTHDPKA